MMTSPQGLVPSATMTTRFGPGVIAGIRRLILAAVASAVSYGLIIAASKGACSGGLDSAGGYLDPNGRPTDVAPTCTTLSLRPSALVFIIAALLVIWALGRVVRRARDDGSALRTINRTALAIAIISVTSVVIAQSWFWLIPIGGIDGSGRYFSPFPFATVTVMTEPLPTA